MSRGSKVKQIVYGLGAFGGGVAILTTVLDKYYNVPVLMEDMKSKRNHIQTLTNQLSMFSPILIQCHISLS